MVWCDTTSDSQAALPRLHVIPRITYIYTLRQDEVEACWLAWKTLVQARIPEAIRKRILSRMYHRYAALHYRCAFPYSYAPETTEELLKDPALFIEQAIRCSFPCARDALPAVLEEPL